MEMDLNFWLQLLTVAFCIGLGGRYGGVGLGAAGGLGVCILVLLFGLKPSSPPVSTILIIVAVIACTSILQGAGGLDWMVKIAERMLRKWPKAITFVAPFVCSLFVIFVGTAYVAFAVYPVVAEVATQARVRPERPIAASVISAGIAVVASPMSAATAALVAALSPYNVSLIEILMISVPAFLFATFCTCLAVYWKGTELENDPEFRRRVESGDFQDLVMTEKKSEKEDASKMKKVRLSVGVFGVSWLTGTFFDAYHDGFVELFKVMAESTPLLFGVVLFLFSAVILSPSATVVALMPLGAAIGIPPLLLVALYPASCGDFLIPGGAQIGCCSFDRTGTTHLGSWVLNHSYLIPGFVHILTGVAAGYGIYCLIG